MEERKEWAQVKQMKRAPCSFWAMKSSGYLFPLHLGLLELEVGESDEAAGALQRPQMA